MKRLYLPLLAGLAGAALLGLLIYGVSTQSASRTLDDALASGAHPVAPQRTHPLAPLSGRGSDTLASFGGKVVLLNFWASWCDPCTAEAPLLERAQQLLQRHGGTVLGVTYRDNSPDSERFIRRFDLTYPNLRDTDGSFANAYGTDALPESFLIDRQGRIVALHRGEIQSAFLNRAIALAEQRT
jgi:cytochrome c biogenesis protein CcmG, thiol:disulfide interchange protein DsbE